MIVNFIELNEETRELYDRSGFSSLDINILNSTELNFLPLIYDSCLYGLRYSWIQKNRKKINVKRIALTSRSGNSPAHRVEFKDDQTLCGLLLLNSEKKEAPEISTLFPIPVEIYPGVVFKNLKHSNFDSLTIYPVYLNSKYYKREGI